MKEQTRGIASARVGPKMIPLEHLVAHPLNSNRMSPELREKLTRNIRRTDNYPHLIVRPHPSLSDRYEILDGHHRLGILKELGHEQARCDVWLVSDREARLLLATLNRLEGQDLPLARAQLMHELIGDTSIDDLAALLPESDKQIEELLALLQFPVDDIDRMLAEQAEKDEMNLPDVLSYVVTKQQREVIEQAVEAASDGTPGRDRRARGLTNLARFFLKEQGDETSHDGAS